MKSPALVNKLKDFASKIGSSSTLVDNAANPASAYSMARRKQNSGGTNLRQPSQVNKNMSQTYGPAAKQKVFGVPGAK